ncbi:FAD binding domain of DNA photolyase [Musa troglodytarum]|uniref:Deoxyribodipyrimidine photo-lyase n=1 Tax=Musa troglodytarum TaxID=320322 RepID=A0A9E7EJS2_9LILI|nr:FAD binding domain of DNA photolyase [Musa troglodytarum]
MLRPPLSRPSLHCRCVVVVSSSSVRSRKWHRPSSHPPPHRPFHPDRVRVLKPGSPCPSGPVVYWMFRDQRSANNWALIHAAALAARSHAPLAVAFCLSHRFLGAHARQLGFMLRGLRLLRGRLAALGLPFFLLRGDAPDALPGFLSRLGASALVADFSPLRPVRAWKDALCERLPAAVALHEVDAHNVVPVWVASGKLEYGAKTIRPKIHRLLTEYLVEFPQLPPPAVPWTGEAPPEIDWDELIGEVVREAGEVPEIGWCEPGEEAAMEALMGRKDGFLTKTLKLYDSDRNDPVKPRALSGLSPYLHFGQISAQRCALEAWKLRKSCRQSVDAFLEELIVRRELADNFCYYQPHYDSLQGAWGWARKTLMDHTADKREHIYTKEQLEKAETADPLWNASQHEMVYHGKMHGFMRMYWAKKILEWTNGPEEALSIAIYLNDKYELDGRDPSGYVGCMWSICGVHDQGWKERPVFGKIRYMNYAGCKRKFNVDGYIAYVNKLVGESKKRKSDDHSRPAAKHSKT